MLEVGELQVGTETGRGNKAEVEMAKSMTLCCSHSSENLLQRHVEESGN